jgi:hypothetical protein
MFYRGLFTVKLVEEEVLVDLLQLYPTPLFFCLFLVKLYLFSMSTDLTSRRTTDDGRRTPSDENSSHDPLGQVS